MEPLEQAEPQIKSQWSPMEQAGAVDQKTMAPTASCSKTRVNGAPSELELLWSPWT